MLRSRIDKRQLAWPAGSQAAGNEDGNQLSHEVVDRAVILTATYFNGRSVSQEKPLMFCGQVGEELVYENTQLGRSHVNVQIDQVVRVISKRTTSPQKQSQDKVERSISRLP